VFSSNKKQYVDILRQNKQLNLDYAILQDNKILKQEQSSFLIVDKNMPQDALFKMDTLQKNIPFTYISSLFEGDRQQVILTQDMDVIGYDGVKLDNKYSIVVPKNELTSTTRYFSNSGIDYIISPFTILNEYVQDQSIKNSLNVLIYNNVVYVMILNDLKLIVQCAVKSLTPFDQIADKSFSDDDIVDQKLYEEVHFLEIQQFLSDVVQDYYTQNSDVEFLEQVKILYTLRPISDEQINSLYETIMVDIDYEAINIEQYLLKIVQKDDAVKHSFIDPRTKKQKKSALTWVVFAGISILIVLGLLYTQYNSSQEITQQKLEQQQIQKVAKVEPIQPKIIEFPNHIVTNNHLLQDIYMLFDIVPYDAVLKDLEITQNSSTYVCMFISKSQSFEDMRVKLLNLYKNSKILLKHENNAILNIILENEDFLTTNRQTQYKQYSDFEFISIGQSTDYINKLLVDQSTIKFLDKEQTDYLTFKFSIKSIVKTPKEFFDFVEKINQQKVSITLEYPIVFSQTNDGIEVKYNLSLHQKNKEQVQLSK
jgi:hypothetical protein